MKNTKILPINKNQQKNKIFSTKEEKQKEETEQKEKKRTKYEWHSHEKKKKSHIPYDYFITFNN